LQADGPGIHLRGGAARSFAAIGPHGYGAGVANPLVGVIMGSDSDLSVMHGAIDVLNDFGVAHEVRVVSAHRTPEVMYDYARSAAGRGLRVIIAAAGGAAALPGMTASMTPLPVIGVPVPLAGLDGLDSLLSIVQMPAGVPVATVAIGNATNAGLLAVRILAAADVKLLAAMEHYQHDLAEQVHSKDAALRQRFGS
jgi:5-(carboxyamino)imidazole ribonucleotide mutase